jgi:hypothetical protein
VHGGNISALWLDAYSLRPAAGRQRDRGGKGGGAKFAFEPASRDMSGHLPRHVPRGFVPVSEDRFAGSFDVARDVELEALARAYDRLIERRAIFRVRLFRSAADRFAVPVPCHDLVAAAPTAEELLKRTSRDGGGRRTGKTRHNGQGRQGVRRPTARRGAICAGLVAPPRGRPRWRMEEGPRRRGQRHDPLRHAKYKGRARDPLSHALAWGRVREGAASLLTSLAKRQAAHHGLGAEAVAKRVDRLFARLLAANVAINEIVLIGFVGRSEIRG